MKENGTTRRDFLKLMAAGGTVAAAGGFMSRTMAFAETPGKEDFGQCREREDQVHLRGWLDRWAEASQGHGRLRRDQRQTSGGSTRDPKNSGGCCNLIEVETLEGKKHKFLLDTGWNNKYMEKVYKREGIDRIAQE